MLDELPLSVEGADQETAVRQYILDRYRSSCDFDRGFKAAAMDDLLYLNAVLPKDWPHYWGLFYPETNSASRDVVERMLGPMFQQETPFGVRGNDGQDEVITQINLERFKADLKQAKYKLNLFHTFQEAVHFGNGVMHTRNVVEIRDGTINVKTVMHPISRFDFFPGEMGENCQEMPHCTWREWVPLPVFRHRARIFGWQHADEIQGSYMLDTSNRTAGVDRAEVWDDVYQRMRLMGYDVREAQRGSGGLRVVELLHYYENGEDNDCRGYGIVADGKHLLSVGPKPAGVTGKPLADWKFAPLPAGGKVWHALGVPALMRAYQDEINIGNAQERDAMELLLHPPQLVQEGSIDKPSKLLPYPNAIIPTQNNEGIKAMPIGTIPASLAYNRDRAQTGIARIIKINDIVRGLGPQTRGADKGTETAAGMQLLTNQSAQSAVFQMLFNDEMGTELQLNQFNELSMIAMIRERTVDVSDNPVLQRYQLGGNTIQVAPEALTGSWSVFLVSTTRAIQTPEQANEWMGLLEKFATKPGVAERINWFKVFEAVAPMVIHRGLHQFLYSDEEVVANQQQMLQQQLLAGALQAGQRPGPPAG